MKFELRPTGSPVKKPDFTQIEWGDPGVKSDIASSVDPWLSQLGSVSDHSIDLVRIAGAAYVADRLTPRRAGFSRTLHLHVHLADSDRWSTVVDQLGELLNWITNDDWKISFSSDASDRPQTLDIETEKDFEAVALFSGGLDSFCGAVLNKQHSLFVSHTDNSIVSASQTRCWDWLKANSLVDGTWVQFRFGQTARKVEPSTRTRCLLFYSLALAVADAHGVDRVEVPENGFTSINVALGNERGGVLSTRSTHPNTMHLIESLLDEVGFNVQIVNPYASLTKGELVEAASDVTDSLMSGAAKTLSCAKQDGRFIQGGNSHYNCGLCVACLTRRGSFVAGGVQDDTPYLLSKLNAAGVEVLRGRRDDDVRAVGRMASTIEQFDEFDLVAQGAFPPDYDYELGADLVRRGFGELEAILKADQ